MQEERIYFLLRELEELLEQGFPVIINAYVIVNTNKFYSLIEKIYASIPPEIQKVHQSRNLCNETYNALREIEISLDQSFHLFPRILTVVNIRQINFLIEKIYASLPTEIQEARSYLESI